ESLSYPDRLESLSYPDRLESLSYLSPASSPSPFACSASNRPSLKSSCAITALVVAGSRIFWRPTNPALKRLGASAARFSNSSTLTSYGRDNHQSAATPHITTPPIIASPIQSLIKL